MKNVDKKTARALLFSVRTPDVSDTEAEESLAELQRLVNTLGLNVVAHNSQRRPGTGSAQIIGEGKLEELAKLTGHYKEKLADGEEPSDPTPDIDEDERINVIIFDCDLSPSQMRNLERAVGVEVMDRTGVIIEIFNRHAKTRSARLQVEIAQLNYMAPRLRETAVAGTGERQAGRGSGESQLELDRRRIRDRVTELKRELEGVEREAANRRTSRSDQGIVALVGYTNAGKSSTMRALTGSQVLVENKLFATLDTTVRALQPETTPRILVSDTVGFIKKLPHDLVASFRSTLEEALNASLLLYVVDAADPTFRSQLEVTKSVLAEVGAQDVDSYLVLNKSDRLSAELRAELEAEFPDAIFSSTLNEGDILALRERIVSYFEKDMIEEEIFAPYTTKGIIGDVRASMRVVSETFENDGVRLKVRSGRVELDRLKKKYHLNQSES